MSLRGLGVLPKLAVESDSLSFGSTRSGLESACFAGSPLVRRFAGFPLRALACWAALAGAFVHSSAAFSGRKTSLG